MNLYPWHQKPFEQLTKLEQSGRLPHALLLSGPLGSGKSEFAQYFTHYLFCQNASDKPCGECQPCRLVSGHTHPDYRLIRLEVDPRTKKQKQDISIVQIRELKSFAELSQAGNTYKVIVIDPADALNNSSSNSLLKLLEEPQGNTILLLVTHQVELLSATIRSRCQVIELPNPDRDSAVGWLESEHQIQNAPQLLKMTQGAPCAALQMSVDEVDQDLDYDRVIADCLSLMFNRGSTIVETAGRWKKYPLKLLLEWQLGLTRDLIRQTSGVAMPYFENQDRYDALQKVQDRINLSKVVVLYEHLIKLKRHADAPLRPETFREELASQWKQA